MNQRILITGGAGFIGVNAADRFAAEGWQVTVLDNLSRRGTEENLDWLRRRHRIRFERLDIRDAGGVRRVVAEVRPEVVLHLAAQVAVTTSVANPREDFEINALGTFNVLEAVRLEMPDAFFINASTNKVYGKMEDVGILERNGRYEYRDLAEGVSETRALDFHSPYGCSKGVADQYTLDYARIYGLDTVSMRQSCIYGTRQLGIEDQGWVAWFTIAAVLGKPLTIYGDGKQVRDVLYVGDLIEAYRAAIARRAAVRGHAFNIGGGPQNMLSLRELLARLEKSFGRSIEVRHADWRPGDQPVFVCDLAKAGKLLGWRPKIGIDEGIGILADWVQGHRELFAWM